MALSTFPVPGASFAVLCELTPKYAGVAENERIAKNGDDGDGGDEEIAGHALSCFAPPCVPF